ncbi:MAG: efflux transporter outer membrane subunit [Acidobacteriota bacterium]
MPRPPELRFTSAALLVSIVLLSACAVNRPPEAATTAARDQVPETPEAWTGAGADPSDVEVGWIDSFEDPRLTTLVREAQSFNKNLQAAAASVDRARALANQAAAALKPSVNLSSGASRAGIASSGNQTSELSLGVDVSWEADLWGRLRANRRGAVASAEAAEADFRYSQHSLAASVARGYFLAIEATRQEAVIQNTIEILERTLEIVNLKYENGAVSAQDVALARSDLASASEQLATIEGSTRDALRALEVLLGRYPAAEVDVGAELPEPPPDPPAGLPSEILERRPDLVAAERRVAAAFDAVDQARAARLPSVGLTGSIGGSSSALSSLLDPANVAWRIGTNLLAPIFDGGQRRQQVEIATADQEQALALYGQAALDAFREVESALDAGGVLERRETELETAAEQAREAYRIADLRYREGESDLLDTLNIQRRVLAAESNLVTVRRLLLAQRVDLHLALGGSWEPVD